MTEVIHALQALFVMAWFVPLALFWRQAFSRAKDKCDQLAAAMWFASLSVIAFPLKWLLLGAPLTHMTRVDLSLWSVLYVTGVVAGLRLTMAVYRNCHGVR